MLGSDGSKLGFIVHIGDSVFYFSSNKRKEKKGQNVDREPSKIEYVSILLKLNAQEMKLFSGL